MKRFVFIFNPASSESLKEFQILVTQCDIISAVPMAATEKFYPLGVIVYVLEQIN